MIRELAAIAETDFRLRITLEIVKNFLQELEGEKLSFELDKKRVSLLKMMEEK